MTRYVAYYRVSTVRQGLSGLGLEAQQSAVVAFGGEVVESYVEVESGKRSDRPQLALALAACKRLGATLIVAKLDRLSRNVAFIATLLESGCEFLACDNPHASRLLLHVMAAFAEHEARCISERTRAALAAYKARGGKLGTPNLTDEARAKGRQANSEAARKYAEPARRLAIALRTEGRTLACIAATLTSRGLLTRRGKAWSATAVQRLLQAA